MSDMKAGQLAFFSTGITDVRRDELPVLLPDAGFSPPPQRQALPSARVLADARDTDQALYEASLVTVVDPKLLSPHKFTAVLHSAIASAKALLAAGSHADKAVGEAEADGAQDRRGDQRLAQGIAQLEDEAVLRDLALAYRNALLAG